MFALALTPQHPLDLIFGKPFYCKIDGTALVAYVATVWASMLPVKLKDVSVSVGRFVRFVDAGNRSCKQAYRKQSELQADFIDL